MSGVLKHVSCAFLIIILFFSTKSYGQDIVNITIETVSVDHNFQCCTDAAGISCGFLPNYPEPRYRLRTQHIFNGVGSGYGATTIINPGTVQCGNLLAPNVILSQTGVCANEVQIEVDMWEEDGCGSDVTYDTGCINDDENRTFISPIFLLTSLTPGVANPITISGSGGYNVNLLITYDVVPTPTNTSTVTSGCPGDVANLSATTSQTVAGMDFLWYDAATGGTLQGTGSPFTPTMTTTTTYYLAYGNVSTCETDRIPVVVTVGTNSIDPIVLNATPSILCSPGSVTLDVSGGVLGSGAQYEWFDDFCGGNLIGTTATASLPGVAISTTTDFFVRISSPCNTTSCVQVNVPVSTPSIDPTGLVASSNNVCGGSPIILSVQGGTLGSGATWEWYENSCGTGNYLGSGNSITVSPFLTTSYFVRAESTCGNTSCASVIVSVVPSIPGPSSATVINDNICPGDTAQVFVTGAVLPAGYTWVWYTGACGAIPVGIGDTISVTPNASTTYYVRATGTCGNTNCTSATVTVLPGSVAATGVLFDNNNFCPGESATLTIDGGSLVAGAQWIWYENGCGGTSIGTGNSLTVTPSSTTSYYMRAEGGTCGNTACANVSINVSDAYAYMVPFDSECGIGQAFTLNNGLPDGGTYSGNGVIGDEFDPAVAGVGTHTITYTYVADNGCDAVASANIQINASTIVASAITVIESCSDGGVTIVVSATGGSGFYNYKWSNGQTGNPLTYVEPGTYSVTVIDGEDCATTISDIVIDASQSCIQVANTFTPNGDGMNDTWNLDFTAYSNANLQVFSKWGTLVYQTDATSIQWNGTDLNGSNLPAGTYYYIIELDGGSINQNGPISIVR
jgi:gliding motility-associated-like protein